MKSKILRKLLGGLSLTTAAFIFQACYGSVQDFGHDVYISGIVKSAKTGAPVNGIRITVANSPQYSLSAADGSFSFYTDSDGDCILQFGDIDGVLNGKFEPKDTTLVNPSGKIHLEVLLKEN
jgi:hypothetical protein